MYSSSCPPGQLALDPCSVTLIPSRTRLHQLVSAPEGEEDAGYESNAFASPDGHDGPQFALSVCSEQGLRDGKNHYPHDSWQTGRDDIEDVPRRGSGKHFRGGHNEKKMQLRVEELLGPRSQYV